MTFIIPGYWGPRNDTNDIPIKSRALLGEQIGFGHLMFYNSALYVKIIIQNKKIKTFPEVILNMYYGHFHNYEIIPDGDEIVEMWCA